jgi:hypothetical protein
MFEELYNNSFGMRFIQMTLLEENFDYSNEFFVFIVQYVNENFLLKLNNFKFTSLVEHLIIFWPSDLFRPIIDYTMNNPLILIQN